MKIIFTCKEGNLRMFFEAEQDDIESYPTFNHHTKRNMRVTLDSRVCQIQLPFDWTLKSVHPDSLAIAAIATVYPFCGPTIKFPFGISKKLHDVFKKKTGKSINPIDSLLLPRKAPNSSSPALAYTGGMDSTAALMLLPNHTKLFFVNRIFSPTQKSLLNNEAALFACDSLKKMGREVYVINSDLEYVRKPVGFATPFAHAVPAILLSDYVKLDSIADGMIMETVYKTGLAGFEDPTEYRLWQKILKTIDMPINLVTSGISEVGTCKMLLHSPYRKITQSCSRGKVKQPCMNCIKCFRKSLLERVLKEELLHDEILNPLFNIKSVQQELNQTPIYHQIIYSYITAKYNGNHPLMNSLKKKSGRDKLQTDLLEKWYSPSVEFVPKKYRVYVKKEIMKYLDVMDKNGEKVAERNYSKK